MSCSAVTPPCYGHAWTSRSRSCCKVQVRHVNHPKRLPPTFSPAATICDALDGFVNAFIEGPPPLPVDPARILSGNFAPVEELPPVSCPVVKGSIPPALAGGAYIRNGPNPQHLPLGSYHAFDGDGMLHSLLLPVAGGSAPATFCSRFVQTRKYRLERKAGGAVLPNTVGAFYGIAGVARLAVLAARVWTGQVNLDEGTGLANTSLVYFANQILALAESDLPYAVRLSTVDGDITTVGPHDFGGMLTTAMTAHPKIDPGTGEMFAFRYRPLPPFLTYLWFDRHGRKGGEVPVLGVREPYLLHDFAITRRYAIFVEPQIMVKPMEMLAGGLPVRADKGKVSRVGVMPRYASSEREMRWFEAAGFNPMHTVNAWDEEDGEVVVLVAPNMLSVEHAIERVELVHSSVEMVRIDLRRGTVVRKTLSGWNLDFPVINPLYVGRRNRYAYGAISGPWPKASGVAKLDYGASVGGDCAVASRIYGEGCYGGEAIFVPRTNGRDMEEDDGFLVSYVHDEKRKESRFLVMDAKSPDLETVAEVLLPRRVPYGFHGIFLTQTQLNLQHKDSWTPRES